MEELLASPAVVGRIHRANALALAIAKNAPNASIAALARRVIVATDSMSDDAPMNEHPAVLDSLRALRDALRQELGPVPPDFVPDTRKGPAKR